MIFKSFEINKINFYKNHFYLLYGENEGLKNEIIQKYFEQKYLKKINRYDEKEILENKENFFDNILSKSFFDNEKLIIISRVSDKIKTIIEEIIEKKVEDIKKIINPLLIPPTKQDDSDFYMDYGSDTSYHTITGKGDCAA